MGQLSLRSLDYRRPIDVRTQLDRPRALRKRDCLRIRWELATLAITDSPVLVNEGFSSGTRFRRRHAVSARYSSAPELISMQRK
jgi:hypothetical protein